MLGTSIEYKDSHYYWAGYSDGLEGKERRSNYIDYEAGYKDGYEAGCKEIQRMAIEKES
jgi:hypothetical protein